MVGGGGGVRVWGLGVWGLRVRVEGGREVVDAYRVEDVLLPVLRCRVSGKGAQQEGGKLGLGCQKQNLTRREFLRRRVSGFGF